ncbi:hypothetical protein [Nocardiopsis quinghaiensis]|uniref:hypothetical protein n=1 Tax=Nocardiopsis quinghaiensis TaxID=464995 RepID=UPI0012388AB1|nr:hypothetical protein [Nocardiopsis quinghaiensis]
MNPEAPGLWARVLVRALVITAAGVMTLGFLGSGEALLVTALAVLTFVLLWLRTRAQGPTAPEPHPKASRDPGRRRPDGY